ncbi:MAG: hypothetical protein GF375_02380 [Candidatus Omnitrophica bacterium]|nr:hypothetical protein [Candidatus Omnitrophota bacterium]
MPIHEICTTGQIPVKVQKINIPNGNAGIMVSAKKMVELIREYSGNQERIRFLAEDITRNCRSKDYLCNAKSIYDWVKANIKWDRDPDGMEMLRSPIVTLDRRVGDCDDHTILIASLLKSIGMPVRIVLIASRSYRPEIYNHVLVETLAPVNGEMKWIAIDTTPLDANGKYFPFGVRPPSYKAKEMGVR